MSKRFSDDDKPRIDEQGYEPVFTNCNVCGRELIYQHEDKMGMCEICAQE